MVPESLSGQSRPATCLAAVPKERPRLWQPGRAALEPVPQGFHGKLDVDRDGLAPMLEVPNGRRRHAEGCCQVELGVVELGSGGLKGFFRHGRCSTYGWFAPGKHIISSVSGQIRGEMG